MESVSRGNGKLGMPNKTLLTYFRNRARFLKMESVDVERNRFADEDSEEDAEIRIRDSEIGRRVEPLCDVDCEAVFVFLEG
jgi:hypothetical protein